MSVGSVTPSGTFNTQDWSREIQHGDHKSAPRRARSHHQMPLCSSAPGQGVVTKRCWQSDAGALGRLIICYAAATAVHHSYCVRARIHGSKHRFVSLSGQCFVLLLVYESRLKPDKYSIMLGSAAPHVSMIHTDLASLLLHPRDFPGIGLQEIAAIQS